MTGVRVCFPSLPMQFCGHALHYSCFEKYFLTVVQPADGQNSVALDVDRGEFHCPLCKAVGNLMVPADTRGGRGNPSGDSLARRTSVSGAPPAGWKQGETLKRLAIEVSKEAVCGGSVEAASGDTVRQVGSSPPRSPVPVPPSPCLLVDR